MSKMIQIRNVPDGIHRILKVRAAKAGLSLSDYLYGELRLMAERPTPEELWERIKSRGSVDPGESAADAIRAGREEREEELIRGEQQRGAAKIAPDDPPRRKRRER